jgi:hypothetical protein
MKLSAESHSLIEQAIKDAIATFADKKEQSVVTDLHLQPNTDSGEFIIYDDNEEELSKEIIEEWVESKDEDFMGDVERILHAQLKQLKEKNQLEIPALIKPYSFVLIDDEKETVTELMLIDDDIMLLGDDLLKGLDKELDEFLDKLLKN